MRLWWVESSNVHRWVGSGLTVLVCDLAQYFVLLSHCCPLYGHTVLCTYQTIRPCYKFRRLFIVRFESVPFVLLLICCYVFNSVPCVCLSRSYSRFDDPSLPYYGDNSKPLRSFGWFYSWGYDILMWDLVCVTAVLGVCDSHTHLRICSCGLLLFGTGQCVLPWGVKFINCNVYILFEFSILIEIGGTISPLLGRM